MHELTAQGSDLSRGPARVAVLPGWVGVLRAEQRAKSGGRGEGLHMVGMTGCVAAGAWAHLRTSFAGLRCRCSKRMETMDARTVVWLRFRGASREDVMWRA